MLKTLLGLALCAGLASAVIDCEELSFNVEAETTRLLKDHMSMVVKDMNKLVTLTADFLEPLEFVDVHPWTDKLRPVTDYDPANPPTNFAEKADMVKLRQILFENIKREDQERPLAWYCIGLKPDTGSNGFSGYFGLSQINGSDKLEQGSYWLDSTISSTTTVWSKFSSSDENDPTNLLADPATPNPKMDKDQWKANQDWRANPNGNPEPLPKSLKAPVWYRWKLNADGTPTYSNGLTGENANWGGFVTQGRPWFIEGLNTAKPMFNTPYTMIVGSDEHSIGIGVVAPVIKAGVGKIGVLDAEFTIGFLSKILHEQREATSGVLYMFDVKNGRNRNIMAISSTAQLVDSDGNLRPADGSHPNPLVAGTAPLFTTSTGYPKQVKQAVGGKDYYVYADEYKSENEREQISGIDWVIVTVWEVEECTPSVDAYTKNLDQALADQKADFKCSNTAAIILGILLLLLALIFGVFVIRSKNVAVIDNSAGGTGGP